MALHGLENSIFVKMSVSPKLINKFNKIPVKCFGFFFEIENLIQNFFEMHTTKHCEGNFQ